jgi:hypothetical protein
MTFSNLGERKGILTVGRRGDCHRHLLVHRTGLPLLPSLFFQLFGPRFIAFLGLPSLLVQVVVVMPGVSGNSGPNQKGAQEHKDSKLSHQET